MVDPRAISTCIEEAVFEERQRAGFSILLDTAVEEAVGKRVEARERIRTINYYTVAVV